MEWHQKKGKLAENQSKSRLEKQQKHLKKKKENRDDDDDDENIARNLWKCPGERKMFLGGEYLRQAGKDIIFSVLDNSNGGKNITKPQKIPNFFFFKNNSHFF